MARKEEKNNSPEKKYIGSMKSVSGGGTAARNSGGSIKTLYSSSAGTKPTSGKNDAKGRSAGDYRYNPASGKYERGSSAGKSSKYEDKTEKIEKSWGKEFYSSGEDLRREEKPVSSLKSFYKPDWEPEPEADPFESSLYGQEEEDEDKVDVGQLIWGLGDQAANQIVGDALGAVDMFIGTPYQKVMDFTEKTFGLADRGENFISAYNKKFQEHAREEAEYYAQNASKGEIASLINQYGPDVLALLPDIALAYFSGGASLAAKGTMAAAKTASAASKISKLDDVADMMKLAGKTIKHNPSLWSGALRTSGQSYNQALAEGAGRDDAAKYALVNGALDLGLNSMGIMRGQAGMETLPESLRATKGALKYAAEYGKAFAHDGVEAVAQGTGQRASRALYDNEVKFASKDDPNAVLNPKSVAMDFVMGGAGAAATGGIHAGTRALDAPANAAAARLERAYFAGEMSKGESAIGYADALKQAELLGRLTKGQMLSTEDINKIEVNNETVRGIFTRETGVPLSSFDIKDENILRQKLNIAAAKTKNRDTIDRYPLERLGYAGYTNVTGKPRNHNYKHGDWTKSVILEDSTHFKREGRYKALKPNVSYVGGDKTPYIYQTDHLTRPRNVTGVLILAPEEMSKYRYGNTPEKIKGYDDAGHIVGRRFKGSGKLDNLLSQCAEVNRGEYKKLEDSWEKALKDGKELYVDFDIGYSGDSKRPEYYDITYYIDGKYNKTRINNPKKQ